jgi:AcrR family transcriptional regulator
MLVRQGYHGLNMDRIAETLEYSKGTIYNHFSCKEEIIIALAIQTMEKRTEMFQRGAAFRGGSRERLLAIGTAAELFVRIFPDHFKLEHLIRSASIWEKTTEKRRDVMRAWETRCISIVGGVVRDAIAQGDLELPPSVSPEDVVFGMWSLSYGAFSIIATSDQLVQLGISDPYVAYRMNITRMTDGYGWRPLSTEYDYDQTRERIKNEVFKDEFRSLAA